MKTHFKSVILTIAIGFTSGLVLANPTETNYTSQIDRQDNSSIQAFRVQMHELTPGNIVEFTVDGESGAKASVRFNSSGKFWREIPLEETESGLYTGKYVIRASDRLQGKTFSLNFLYRKQKYTANYSPVNAYVKNPVYEDKNVQAYKNPNLGKVTSVEITQVASDEISLGGSAVGAVGGGLLGSAIGGGNGKKVATILGAVGGGLLGNQVGKNMNKQNVWNVYVTFEDGQSTVFKYSQDPHINVGLSVRRDGETLIRRQ